MSPHINTILLNSKSLQTSSPPGASSPCLLAWQTLEIQLMFLAYTGNHLGLPQGKASLDNADAIPRWGSGERSVQISLPTSVPTVVKIIKHWSRGRRHYPSYFQCPWLPLNPHQSICIWKAQSIAGNVLLCLGKTWNLFSSFNC